jgi:hypothetical protein
VRIGESHRVIALVAPGFAALAACANKPAASSAAVDSTFTIAGQAVPAARINSYLSTHLGFTSRGGDMHCAYTPLGQDSTRIFIQTLCLELVQSGDSVAHGSGRGGPVALTVTRDGDSVRIVSHDVPVDGGGQAESIRRIFPASVAEQIFAGGAHNDKLEAHLRAAAQARLSRPVAVRTSAAGSVGDLIEERVPRAAAGDSGWAYQQRVAIDFNADGRLETAILLCDVVLDGRGRPLWEDGHRWQVYIEESDGARTWVYARFLPNGSLHAAISQPSKEGPPTLLLQEETPQRIALHEVTYRSPGDAVVSAQLERMVDPIRVFSGAARP